MGEVWKARDTRLDRMVAIKVSKKEFSERFEREARAVAALNHPHICQLYDVGPNYLVMEFIEGEPLLSQKSRARCRSKKRSSTPRRSATLSMPRTARGSRIAI